MASEIDLPELRRARAGDASLNPSCPAAGPDQPRVAGNRSLPLSAEQRDRWLAQRFDPPSAPSRVHGTIVEFPAQTGRARVAAAVERVIAAHEALRLAFPADGETQEVLPVHVPVTALRDIPPGTDAVSWGVSEIGRRLASPGEPGVCFGWRPGRDSGTLVVAAHPVVLDASSARAVVAEILDLAAGGAPKAASGGGGFAAWAATESVRERSPAGLAAREFWRQRLATVPELLDLPLDRSRPAVAGGRGVRVERVLPAAFVSAVDRAAEALGLDRELFLLAGWSALLQRLAASDAFLLGVVLPNRTGIRGPLETMRPLYVACRGDASFAQLAEALRAERSLIEQHAEADLGGLVREMRLARDPARPWMTSATLRFETGRDLGDDDASARVHHRPSLRLESDLALTVSTRRDSIVCELVGNADVFHEDTARRWLRHLEVLLLAAAHEPDTAVDDLPWLTAEEEQGIRRFHRAELPAMPDTALLHRAFERSARGRPDHAAVVMEGRELTYAALDALANNLAQRLVHHGAGPGRFVALVLDRSLEYAIATLGVLKSGAAFVPIDPEWPVERQSLVIQDCGASVVLTAGRGIPGGLAARVTVLDVRTISSGAASPPAVPVGPEDLAYLIYTSGSTGVPKGVMVSHQAAAVHMASISRVYRLGPDDRSLLFHSVAFDPAVEQLFAPWVEGGTVHVRGDGLWTGREFAAWVRSERITAVTLPPLYFLQLLRDWEHEPALAPTGQLRRVLVGGEALAPAVVELWRKLGLTSIRLLNGYGPTECTVTATVHDVPAVASDSEATGRIPVGLPQGPVEAYVLDEKRRILPVGVPGELCLAGPTLARGYLHRDELTREKFIPHPWKRGASLYRTGDRARLLPDGAIDFCGRADRQIKIAGYRVEPGEVEAALGRCSGVSACAVVVEKDERGDAGLVGYVVPTDPATFREEALGAELARGLPRYMLPRRLFPIASLPRTINGKLDTAALARHGREVRQREAQEHDDRAGVVTPRDPIEAQVAETWQRILSRTGVRAGDDFFLCGGHSLLAIALFAQLERAFSVRLALSDWLGEPTFGALAALVRRAAGESGERDEVRRTWRFLFPIRASGGRPPLFLFAGGRGCDEDFVVLAALTRAVSSEQPIWGLRLGGPDRLDATHASAEAMAADVVREMREFQPSGPYHIAGECIGGLLAYEVARRLHEAGETVAFLGLINTGCPRLAEPLRWWVSTSWIGRARQGMRPLLGAVRQSRTRDIPGHVRTYLRFVAQARHSGRAPRDDGMPEDPKDYFYGRLLLRYKPAGTPVPMTLFGCETYKRAVNLRRWARHAAGGVHLVPIPGNTTTCIREHAAKSARALDDALEAAIAGEEEPRPTAATA